MPLKTVLFLLSVVAVAANDEEFEYTQNLWTTTASVDEQPKFSLSWRLDDEGDIYFKAVVGVVDRWFGFGVSESGAMKGADMAIFHESSTEGFVLEDFWSVDYTTPVKDVQQDLVLVDVQVDRDEIETTVIWKRRLKSCDTEEDLDFYNAATSVIFAIGSSPELSYHGTTRGTAMINWYKGDITLAQEAKIPADALPFPVIAPEAAFINNEERTQYYCVVIPAPEVAEDHHIVKMEPHIDTKFAHHMIITACTQEPDTYNGQQIVVGEHFNCGVMIPTECRSQLGGWAVGAGSRYYVDEYGVTFTPDMKYIFIQTHYDNPNLLTGYDNSGMNFYLSPTLRPYSLQNSVFGFISNGILLPPGEEATTLAMTCPSGCTEAATQPSKIVSVSMHMHERGKYIYLEHYRNGVRLPDIASQHWDFNFQEQREVPDGGVEWLPGDEMRLRCIYDTSQDTEPIQGGDGTNNEMCLAFISSYPPNSVEICVSGGDQLSGDSLAGLSAMGFAANLDSSTMFERLGSAMGGLAGGDQLSGMGLARLRAMGLSTNLDSNSDSVTICRTPSLQIVAYNQSIPNGPLKVAPEECRDEEEGMNDEHAHDEADTVGFTEPNSTSDNSGTVTTAPSSVLYGDGQSNSEAEAGDTETVEAVVSTPTSTSTSTSGEEVAVGLNEYFVDDDAFTSATTGAFDGSSLPTVFVAALLMKFCFLL